MADHSHVPIPTYEEATTGLLRPESPHSDDSNDDRHIEELDYLEAPEPSSRLYHRARLRGGKWAQQLGAKLSSLSLPSPWLDQVRRFFRRLYIPQEYRMSGPTAARLAGLFLLATLTYVLFVLEVFPGAGDVDGDTYFPIETVRAAVQGRASGENVHYFLMHLTKFDHVAGTEGDFYLAKWVKDSWKELGKLDSLETKSYYVYLDYPGERSLTLKREGSPAWSASFEEDSIYKDREQTLAWHARSKSGEAEGHLIYANGGSANDFARLHENGIVTNGSIALVKSGGTQPSPGLKVQAAQDAGCVGVMIYSDPSDVPPDSAWRPPDDMIQRDDVSLTLGDPLTPGHSSTLNAKRLSPTDADLPKIPSLPLSWRDARILLLSLKNTGLKLPGGWIHGPKSFELKQWWSGNVTTNSLVHLKSLNEGNLTQEIWNVHGAIRGSEFPNERVVIGAHRDSWCYGAIDGGSGTAILLEVVHIFSVLRDRGWRPLRTIEFVSFDAAEYNLAGSTEFVEENLSLLKEEAVAFINIEGVAGPTFHAAAPPSWRRVLEHVLARVDGNTSPSDSDSPSSLSEAEGSDTDDEVSTLLSSWRSTGTPLHPPTVLTDTLPFLTLAGVSTLSVGFTQKHTSPSSALPRHSCHDTIESLATFVDPDYALHKHLTQVIALLVVEFSAGMEVPLDLKAYAEQLSEWITVLERETSATFARLERLPTASPGDVERATNFTLKQLKEEVGVLERRVNTFYERGRMKGGSKTVAGFEKGLVHPGGRHVVFGREGLTGEVEGSFRGVFGSVRERVDKGEWEEAMKEVERVRGRVESVGRGLE
ncbi:Zn-dependent exopeptidase [Piedraia hortae CBS 480.64]|uniref:Zn-dependent exopeptidase n=1 Tax=Piedraia hortae CBS 480.64 TaxID=1314780 RepID=A0A6A7BWW2_9PEZI|nr:Zn-dependent exopeptidase [Piedraia hortae CBS 480.64]